MQDPRETLRVLMALTRRLARDETLDGALQAVTDAALRLAPARHASVRLFDDSGDKLLCSARSGDGAGHRPVRFRPGEGLVGWVATSGQSLRLADTAQDPRFTLKPGQGFSVTSYLAVPLWSGSAVIGVLALTSPEPDRFTEDDEVVAQLLANCVVPAIEKARLREIAITDDRTRAYNHRHLMPRLRREMDLARAMSRALSMLLLDLDLFKRVNDEHGHPRGDEVLSAFVDRLRDNVRSRDALVRRGGDEFILIMPATPEATALAVAERIRSAVAAAPLLWAEDVPIAVTATIGVALWNGAESPEALEKRADKAMYEGKRAGRNRVVSASDEGP